MSSIKCKLCGYQHLQPVYNPPTSKRAVTVQVCLYCGLIQSTIAKIPDRKRKPNVSAGADFGGVRYGKSFRAAPNLEMLKPFLGGKALGAVLDVGASRGHFARLIMAWGQPQQIMAVEPDTTILDWWLESETNIDIIPQRIEQTDLHPAYFDLIYLGHTLEHLDEPVQVLARLRSALKLDGLLFVEVPDAGLIDSPYLIEEFFLDKHVCHFSMRILRKLLQYTGFRVLKDVIDHENLTVIATPTREYLRYLKDGTLVKQALDWCDNYKLNQSLVEPNLKRAAAWWNRRLKKQPTAIWGAGRILDSLIKAGLQIETARQVIDTYLPPDKVKKAGKVQVVRPDELEPVEVIMICSREYANEIALQARQILPEVEVKRWDESLRN